MAEVLRVDGGGLAGAEPPPSVLVLNKIDMLPPPVDSILGPLRFFRRTLRPPEHRSPGP